MPQILLLGPLEVREGEQPVDIRRRKQRALLATLALRVGHPVSPDRLVDDLWAEHAPRTAKHALENYVSELRKALGRDVIGTRSGGYVLDLPDDDVDAAVFERLLSEARDLQGEERIDKLVSALALVRGQPLADLLFEPFAQHDAPRLAELELRAREELIGARLELGQHADVVAELDRLVAAHPYRESLRAQLMLALYRSGRQADALATYQDARRALVDELGIDPGDDLTGLERAILRQDPALRAPTQVAVATATPRSSAAGRPARKTVTILLAELTNAGALADALDPEPLRAILDRYGNAARGAAERHEGTCARTGAESFLAVFGAPASHEDDALRAIRAAHELREEIGVLNDGLFPEHGLFLEVGTGVTTGEVLVTPDGDELATGRAVVHAEELVRAGQPGQILLDGRTYDRARESVGAEEIEVSEEAFAGAFRLVELLPDAFGRALRLDSPLVGRRRQLATLENALESAISDPGLHLATVFGAAGVGKSRLAREFAEGTASVATVLRGRCAPYGETDPIRPLLEALGEASRRDGDPQSAAELRTQLEQLALERPLLVVLDDLHWAESQLLDVIEELAVTSRAAPVLLLCLARPDLLDRRPSWGGGKPNASAMMLEPLSEAESDRLVDNLLGESDLPGSVRDHVIRTADGNPLFVEEFLATLVETSVLTREAGRWTTTEVAAIPIPPTIHALIGARIDRLPEDERVVLEIASIEGKTTFQRDVVTELAPVDLRTDVDRLLEALVRTELVRPQLAQPDAFSFRHPLIRDVAYAAVPIERRVQLHEGIAGLFDARQEGPLAQAHRERAQTYRTTLGVAQPPGSLDHVNGV